jgi:hypothetical protein
MLDKLFFHDMNYFMIDDVSGDEIIENGSSKKNQRGIFVNPKHKNLYIDGRENVLKKISTMQPGDSFLTTYLFAARQFAATFKKMKGDNWDYATRRCRDKNAYRIWRTK